MFEGKKKARKKEDTVNFCFANASDVDDIRIIIRRMQAQEGQKRGIYGKAENSIFL